MSGVHDAERLKELQALPLSRKIQITQTRIIEWYLHFGGNVCVSFSGGKDSTVLLHIARQLYPDIPAVFSNTGLEYPEIQKFVRDTENVTIVTPEIRFTDVIQTYGYPLIGKEVAEAIYYARRIRVGEKRERDGKPTYSDNDPQTPRTLGKEGRWKRRELGGGKNHLIQTSTARNRRTVLSGQMSRAGVTEDGTIGEGGVFSNGDTRFGTKSAFNKVKWLPLARDLPVLISHRCCDKMKKSPLAKYQRRTGYKPILGTLTEESRVRKQAWIRHGCNAFDSKKQVSQPLSFWTEQDILQYIADNHLEIASVYGEIVGEPGCLNCSGCNRTGCIFCAFGMHMDKGESRFQRLAVTHPRQYEYCIGGGEWVDNPFYVPDAPEYDGEWKNWNPKKIWTCNQKGLGMGKVFDMVNELYGKEMMRY